MFWFALALVALYGSHLWTRPDPMKNLLDEMSARELFGQMLAVPRYERIVREILAVKDGDR